MITETLIYRSDSNNPWYNLAIEELLLDTVEENQCILYLWQNRDTIVVGKNQNPWKECQGVMLEKDGGYLARRLSGGGTVFHDLGNLNFTFLMNRKNYDLEKQVGVILSAVRKLGIDAEMTGRNDLTVDGRKFSGNAFCFQKNNAYHHGTILVSSDFDKLTRYLTVSPDKIISKGIQSVRSRVVNLTEFVPTLTIDAVMESFCTEFTRVYGGYPSLVKSTNDLNQNVIENYYKKYSSWEWRYGEAPHFDMEISNRFSWGGVDICLRLDKGMITNASIYSDAMDEEFIGMLPQYFKERQLNAAALSENLRQMSMNLNEERKTMQEDIAAWFEKKTF